MGLGEPLETEISTALRSLKDRLRDELGDSLEKLVLFGSRARGDFEAGSDVDVAIVIRGLDSSKKQAILNLIAEIELEHLVPLSTLVMSSSDFAALKERERRIALDIEREGVPL